ncbi:MAG TPA: HAD family phosphatase [Thermoanaerobaculia bacterium]|nr:HAD family phosphatase [Thermoanaerobaculia bacterium]
MIFDFDETIIDLEPQHTHAHDALCRAMNAEYAQLPESFRTSSGLRIIDDIREMRAHFGWDEPETELFAMRQRFFDDACARSELVPMEGVIETIDALRKLELTLAITSSAVRSSIEVILTRLGIRDAFALIIDGSEVVHGKPDPEAYLVTARKLGLAPHECIVIEDSQVGVVAAKRAGMFCIAVRNPRAQTIQDLSAADVIVDSMRAVIVPAPR